jgi:Caspase domain
VSEPSGRFAVVVGIDEYADQGARLLGAVGDALAMCEWLVKPADALSPSAAGGGVPPANVRLLISRGPVSTPPSPALAALGIKEMAAKRADILVAVQRLLAEHPDGGERLYVYFSGHGFSSGANARLESAIACADFTVNDPSLSFTLQSLYELFRASAFREQFFFIDACRNPLFPPGTSFDAGTIRRNAPDPTRRPVEQFVFHATAPGARSQETGERGAFTGELLRGLGGAGKAKVWSALDEVYVVRFDNLVTFVSGQVANRRSADARPDEIQVPQRAGESTSNPILARFDDAEIAPVQIEVTLDPAPVAGLATVRLKREGNTLQEATAAGPAVSFSARPKEYGIVVQAPNLRARPERAPVDAYDPTERVTITLEVVRDLAGTRGSELATLESTYAFFDPVKLSGPGEVHVWGSTDFAPLELADSSGRVVRLGLGTLDVNGLAPGFYRARLVLPEKTVEKLVDVEPGRVQWVELGEAIPTVADRLLPPVHRAVGSPAATRQITIYPLRAGDPPVASRSSAEHDPLGEALGLERGGVCVLVDGDAASILGSRFHLRLWPADAVVPAERCTLAEGAPWPLRLVAPAATGMHWLSIEIDGRPRPLILGVPVLEGCVSLLELTVERGAIGRATLYFPSAHQSTKKTRPALCRADRFERFIVQSRLDFAKLIAAEVLGGALDPAVICLAGVDPAIIAAPDVLRRATAALVERHPELPDAHVLVAEHLAAGDAERCAAYRAALSAGIPVFAKGLTRLCEAVQRMPALAEQGAFLLGVYRRGLPGALLSLWERDSLRPGQPLRAADGA